MKKTGPTPPFPALPGEGGDLRLQMALRQIGFDPRQAAPAPKAPSAPKAPKTQPLPAPDDSRALKRREWLLDTMERQRALSPYASGLLTAENLSTDQFLHDFYAPGRPVVIKGAMAGWPAQARWTPDYLADLIGEAIVEFQGGRDGAGDYELMKDRHKRRAPFRQFIALARKGGNDAYLTAYNSAANGDALAPLQADLGHPDAYLSRAPGMLWIGGAGAFTPLHFDLTNNMLAQVTGAKQIILIPPSQTRHLAHDRHVFSDVHDITDPARLALFPAARDLLRYEVRLTPGDLLFIPIGWWHQVRSESFSTMLTYTGFHWPNAGHETYPG